MKFRFISKMPLLFLLIWGLDRCLKVAVSQLQNMIDLGFITIRPTINYGLILNSFSNLPAEIKLLLFSMTGACIFGFYLLTLYIVDSRASRTRTGLTCVFAGIMANFSDRFVYDGVIDYISISAPGFRSPYFNFADLCQWIGYGILVWGVFKESNILRLISTRRAELLVLPHLQRKIVAVFLVISLCFNFLCAAFTFAFLKTTINLLESVGMQTHQAISPSQLISAYLWSHLAMAIMSTSMMLIFGLRFSHRIAGPVFAFQRYFKELYTTTDHPEHEFKLRDTDELKELEVIAKELKNLHIQFKAKAPVEP